MRSSSKYRNIGVGFLLMASLIGGIVTSGHADETAVQEAPSSDFVSGIRHFGRFLKHFFTQPSSTSTPIEKIQTVSPSPSPSAVNRPQVSNTALNTNPTVISDAVEDQDSAIERAAGWFGHRPVGNPQIPSNTNIPQANTATAPTSPLSGNNRAILFGGSCDEGAAKNSFLQSFVDLASQLTQNGWDVRPLYEGDIARCSIPASDAACKTASPSSDCCPAYADMSGWAVDPLAAAAKKSPSDVGRASARELISNLAQAAQDLKSGDQLLLDINTHGYGYPQPGQTEKKHYICVAADDPHGKVTWTDPNNGATLSAPAGLMAIDDPRLQAALQKLKEAGVKVAIIDDSCFGGGSVLALSQYGCVMTATGSQQENMAIINTGSFNVGKKQETGTSGTDVSYNLTDLLRAPSAPYSMNSSHLTMEELWLRMLSHSRMADNTPEFSGILSEQKSVDDINTWLKSLDHDAFFRDADSPLNGCADCITPQIVQDYAGQFLSSYLNQGDAQNNFVIVQSYWPAPGVADQFDAAHPASMTTISSQIGALPSQWAGFASRHANLVAQESQAREEIRRAGMNIQLNFDGPLFGTQDLFNTIVTQNNGTSFDMYVVSSGEGAALLEDMSELLVPSDQNFASVTKTAISSIAYKMNAHKLQNNGYTAGLPDSYAQQLSDMIVQAETTAWNALPAQTQNMIRKEFQTITALRTQEQAIYTEMLSDTKAYLVQARMYSYLSFRDRVGSSDANFNSCHQFNFRAY